MKDPGAFIAKAERFLQSAEHLYALGDYESAVSRCYYAMFHLAEAALMSLGISAASHKGVITLFGKHLVQTGIFRSELGRMLRRAYDLRTVGDYVVDVPVSQKQAADLLEATRQFVEEVRAYLEKQRGG